MLRQAIEATRAARRALLAALAALGGSLGAGSALADDVYWSVGIEAPIAGGGGVRTRIGNTPPAPRVVSAPVIVTPAPVVVAHAPGGGHGWKHHGYAPRPVYHYHPSHRRGWAHIGPRVVVVPPPVYHHRGKHWDAHDRHRWAHRGWDDRYDDRYADRNDHRGGHDGRRGHRD